MTATLLHLVNEIPYVETLCGLSLDVVGDYWTDSLVEVVEQPNGPTPRGTEYYEQSECPTCLENARKIVASIRCDKSWQREAAMESGMLHGVEAYNDAMGWA